MIKINKNTKLEKDIYSLMDVIYPISQDIEILTGIVCGVHNEDIKEFTDLLIENKDEIKEPSDLLELFVWFRNYKKYNDN